MVVGSALEDARHLAHRYDRVKQEVEAQVTTTAECDKLTIAPVLNIGIQLYIKAKYWDYLNVLFLLT